MKHLKLFEKFLTKDQKTETNLKEWFGKSLVVDKSGKPAVWYHGTNAEFDEFSMSSFGQTDEGYYGRGFYFTDAEIDAKDYGRIIMDCYLKVENPFWLRRNGTMGHSIMHDLRDDIAALPGMPKTLKTNRTLPDGYVVKKRKGQERYGEETVVYSVSPKPELYGTDKEIYGDDHYYLLGRVGTDGKMKKRDFNEKNAELDAIVSFNDQFHNDDWDQGWAFGLTRSIGRMKFTEAVQKAGYDGIFVVTVDEVGETPKMENVGEIIVFDSSQIKSASKNNGNFDPDSQNIYEED